MAFPCLAASQTAILQIRVVEGDGAVHAAGSRDSRPLAVEVTDETGKPLARAAVSFHLPDDGPSGTFLNGLRTEVAMTDATGHASVRGLQWNRVAGRLEVRIVASFEQARAGVISAQYVEGSAAAAVGAPARGARSGRNRWLVVAALAAGGAAAGILAGHLGGSGATAAAAAPATPGLSMGTPTITVTKP
jgi:hypothetical protein